MNPVTCSYFYSPSPWGLASFLFSPLIGQVFRRERRIGGASEFTPSSSVVLQSKSCAFSRIPLLSFLSYPRPPSFLSPFSSLPPSAILDFARAKIFSLRFPRPSSLFRLRPPSLSAPPSQRGETRRRVVDHRGSMNSRRSDSISLGQPKPNWPVCRFENYASRMAALSSLHPASWPVSLRSMLEIPCVSLSIRDTR